MNNPYAALRARQLHNDGYRTPAIEDDDHPLNLWRSQQSQRGPLDCYFPSQDHITREQFDRLRKLDTNLSQQSERRRYGVADSGDHLPWKERVKHTTWAYFTMCMATGGLANVLHAGTPLPDVQLYTKIICFRWEHHINSANVEHSALPT